MVKRVTQLWICKQNFWWKTRGILSLQHGYMLPKQSDTRFPIFRPLGRVTGFRSQCLSKWIVDRFLDSQVLTSRNVCVFRGHWNQHEWYWFWATPKTRTWEDKSYKSPKFPGIPHLWLGSSHAVSTAPTWRWRRSAAARGCPQAPRTTGLQRNSRMSGCHYHGRTHWHLFFFMKNQQI